MRNILYLAIAATTVAAHPLRPDSNNEHMTRGGPEQGVFHDHHCRYPNSPWDCSEHHGRPTWSRFDTPWASHGPPATWTTPTTQTSQVSTSSSMASNSTAPPSSSGPSNSTITSTPPQSSRTSNSTIISTLPQSSQISNSTITSTPPQSSQPGNSTIASTLPQSSQIAPTGSVSAVPSSSPRPSGSTLTPSGSVNVTSTVTGSSSIVASSAAASGSSITSISTSFSVFPNRTSSSTLPSSTPTTGADYTAYCGDGSVAQGWPSMSQWLDFDHLFEQNRPSMRVSCAAWGVPDDSDEEIDNLKKSIEQVANLTGIDARFILAIVMQESTGCVRVITTAYSHFNPGLMQSWSGSGSCNGNLAPLGIAGTSESNLTTPCPYSEIYQMILDGTNGTAAPDSGLRQNFAQQGLDSAAGYYRTAKIYNGGFASFSANQNSLESGCCTSSYASDVANRLMGWFNNASRQFTC